MATKTINGQVKSRTDTAANWTSVNPVLLAGELGIESDTHRMKAGDGTTAWSSLPYLQGPSNVTLSVEASAGSSTSTWIEVPTEDMYIGRTEPTDQNTIWLEVSE